MQDDHFPMEPSSTFQNPHPRFYMDLGTCHLRDTMPACLEVSRGMFSSVP